MFPWQPRFGRLLNSTLEYSGFVRWDLNIFKIQQVYSPTLIFPCIFTVLSKWFATRRIMTSGQVQFCVYSTQIWLADRKWAPSACSEQKNYGLCPLGMRMHVNIILNFFKSILPIFFDEHNIFPCHKSSKNIFWVNITYCTGQTCFPNHKPQKSNF